MSLLLAQNTTVVVHQYCTCTQCHCIAIVCILTYLFSIDSCTYRLENEDLIVSELFQFLDSVRDQIRIVGWGIKMTTMEDGDYSLFHSLACVSLQT